MLSVGREVARPTWGTAPTCSLRARSSACCTGTRQKATACAGYHATEAGPLRPALRHHLHVRPLPVDGLPGGLPRGLSRRRLQGVRRLLPALSDAFRGMPALRSVALTPASDVSTGESRRAGRGLFGFFGPSARPSSGTPRPSSPSASSCEEPGRSLTASAVVTDPRQSPRRAVRARARGDPGGRGLREGALRVEGRLVLEVCARDNHRAVLVLGIRPEPFQERPTVHPGHRQVEQDHVRLEASLEELDRIPAIRRLDHAVAPRLEPTRDELAELVLVLHDQHARAWIEAPLSLESTSRPRDAPAGPPAALPRSRLAPSAEPWERDARGARVARMQPGPFRPERPIIGTIRRSVPSTGGCYDRPGGRGRRPARGSPRAERGRTVELGAAASRRPIRPVEQPRQGADRRAPVVTHQR